MSTDFRTLCVELIDVLAELPFGTCEELVVRARAALAQPVPPVAGEVGELVAKLRRLAPQNPLGIADPTLTRAADLLAQRYPEPIPALPEDATVIEPSERTILVPHQAPVPVSERLPAAKDLNDKGECWEWDPTSDAWVLLRPIGLTFRPGPWLPAHALPLPAGEVGHG